MAKFVLKDAEVFVDSVDLSEYVSSVTIETSFDEVDVTGMGSVYRENLQGLGDATMTVTFFQDFDAAAVDATLWPLSQSGEVVEIAVKPTSDVASETNPAYRMDSALFGYSPLAGSIGEASSTEVTFRNASQAGLVRDESYGS